jgi:hypothetical protein
MTQEPTHGSEEAHPFPKDWRIAANVAGFIQNYQHKEYEVGGDDCETPDR